MSKFNIKEKDPVKYERVREEQQKMRAEFASHTSIARLCPYCDTKVEILFQGSHGASASKCPSCGEQIIFPPVEFSVAG